MKKKNSLIPVRQAVEDAFYEGLRLGFSIGDLSNSIAPKFVGKNEKQIAEIWRKEIDVLFKEFAGRFKKGNQ